MLSTDAEVFQLRKQLSQVFYDAYYKVFMNVMKDDDEHTPIIDMFLNFRFMDVQMVGEDNANILYDLTEHLELCNSEHIFTIFE